MWRLLETSKLLPAASLRSSAQMQQNSPYLYHSHTLSPQFHKRPSKSHVLLSLHSQLPALTGTSPTLSPTTLPPLPALTPPLTMMTPTLKHTMQMNSSKLMSLDPNTNHWEPLPLLTLSPPLTWILISSMSLFVIQKRPRCSEASRE